MSTELFIVMLSVDLVAHLRVRITRKFAVVACFAPRLLVVAAALVRAVYLYQVTPHGNPEYDLWISTICTQAHVCASICTACIPYMVPFFKSLQASIWRSYSTRSWTARSRSAHLSGTPPNVLRKREANIRFESPKSFTSLIKEPERVSIVSPRIPSPTPISPFMPPPISTLRLPTVSLNASGVRTARGLSVSGTLYDSESGQLFEMVSLQTAMSYVPSPIEPPAKARLSSSVASSRAATPTRAEHQPRFSLFPQDAQQYAPLLPLMRRISSSSARDTRFQDSTSSDGAPRLLARQTLPDPAILHTFDNIAQPTRSISLKSHPKFSTTPRLHAAPPSALP
ncbi:hypothetical protein EJ07DRAFT_156206 [Lizonia empirigonia]|nr:hypothetical protein EJ07DRAFT_156206 [Lizonia empirigonia]